MRFIETAVAVVVLLGTAFQTTPVRTNANPGQIGKKFEIFFSPYARAETFLVDTSTGSVSQMVMDQKVKQQLWEKVNFLGGGPSDNVKPSLIDIANGISDGQVISPIGPICRYQIVFGLAARADTFLLDTSSGRCWQYVVNADNSGTFQKMAAK